MKKVIAAGGFVCIALILASFYSAGCHSAYRKGYQSGYEEAYWNGRADGQAHSEKGYKAIVMGEFAASVLAVLPHANFAHLAADTAVVTEFQSDEPFCLYVGEEIAESLEVGGIYVFQIEEKQVEGVRLSDALSEGPLDTPETVHAYHLRTESVRPAKEGEYDTGVSLGLRYLWLPEGTE